jgi:P pilus assembly chaperone PapD
MLISHVPLALSGILWVATSACSSPRAVVHLAPSNQTVRAATELTFSGDGQHIYVTNSSSVPIMVTGLRLTDCENIKNRCETIRLRVLVAPGQRQNLIIVKPDNTNRAHSFRYNYTWEPAQQP